MTVAPGVFVTLLDRHYAVAGTSVRHLMEVAVLTSPRRGRTQHVGYTDWQIGWSYTPQEIDGRFVVGAARVEVVVTRTLPRWRPPAAAESALVSSWTELVAAIAKHEQGHVDVAVHGAHSLHSAIVAVLPAQLGGELQREVAAVAESALETIRNADLAYDEATRHGALQGVRLPW